ncbi:tRNA (adenosine(37)-N6)-threonylcarbamoyltransferase complex dimerization subunit type 1 TsaB [Peijinzhouia sedimentorum]
MSIILALETSTPVCSVSLFKNEELLSYSELRVEKSQSSNLTSMIKHCLEYAGVAFDELDAVAVSKGPGSYTGLRIGVSTAKGICIGSNCKLIGINSLEGMLHSAVKYKSNFQYYVPMIDARRMEVYCLVGEAGGSVISDTKPEIIDESSFMELGDSTVVFFGDGAEKLQEVFKGKSNFHIWEGFRPDAKSIGVLANEKFKNQEFEDVAYFEPFYLKAYKTTQPKKLF